MTGQLAAERRGRRVDQGTIEALREQLAQAQATIEQIREEPCRHDREEAVLAEAIAITEQALVAERAGRARKDRRPRG
ncbi:hypothetical protein [Streptomyces sp. NPDC014006]|uniref:hypothetical protein n=1 Tax=Streptomyces sp. NPDC014006 TaxID=3364870 RepID=UPI0036FFA1CE